MIDTAPLFENIARIGGPQLLKDVLEELHKGEMLQRDAVDAEVLTWSENTARRCPGVDGMGTITSEIPADIYFDWDSKEPGFWKSSADRQWFLNKNPQFKVKYQPKAQVAWTNTLDRTDGGIFIGHKYGPAQ